MIEEIIADRIEGIFEQKQLGHISSDHAREQLIKQLMYLTQSQREACAKIGYQKAFARLTQGQATEVSDAILNAQVQP